MVLICFTNLIFIPSNSLNLSHFFKPLASFIPCGFVKVVQLVPSQCGIFFRGSLFRNQFRIEKDGNIICILFCCPKEVLEFLVYTLIGYVSEKLQRKKCRTKRNACLIETSQKVSLQPEATLKLFPEDNDVEDNDDDDRHFMVTIIY